jgi:PleD family two-component response regulator
LLAANQQLQLFAFLDGLTGVANSKKFDEYLNLEWQRLAREKLPLS